DPDDEIDEFSPEQPLSHLHEKLHAFKIHQGPFRVAPPSPTGTLQSSVIRSENGSQRSAGGWWSNVELLEKTAGHQTELRPVSYTAHSPAGGREVRRREPAGSCGRGMG